MRKLLILPLFLLVPGCVGDGQFLPGEAYVADDRETYEVVKPYLEDDNDPLLNARVRAWNARIEAAEARYKAMKEQR